MRWEASGVVGEEGALRFQLVHPGEKGQTRRQPWSRGPASVTLRSSLQLLFAAQSVFLQLDEDAIFSPPDQVDVLAVLCTEDHPETPRKPFNSPPEKHGKRA